MTVLGASGLPAAGISLAECWGSMGPFSGHLWPPLRQGVHSGTLEAPGRSCSKWALRRAQSNVVGGWVLWLTRAELSLPRSAHRRLV
eukprot:14940521-Alexandrium_andersonii.AAC.1